MTKTEIVDDLQLAGYFACVKDDCIWIEGTSENGVDWVIEEDFDAWWLYEFTGKDYYSVDAFGNMDDSLNGANKL